jgi:hypothetical protein
MKNKKIKTSLALVLFWWVGGNIPQLQSQGMGCTYSYNSCMGGASYSYTGCARYGGKLSECHSSWDYATDMCMLDWESCMQY